MPLKICLISFLFDSSDPHIAAHYVGWTIEALHQYRERKASLPDLVLTAGFACMDDAGLAVLEREFHDERVSLAVEMLDPTDDPLVGSRRRKGCGQFYVIGRGKCSKLAPRQQFTSSGNIREELADKVIAGLALDGERRFSVLSRQVGWIECGEVNMLRCQQNSTKSTVSVRYESLEQRFFEAMTSLDIVLNPQHTRMSRLHLLRRKAEALSAGTIAHAPPGKRWPLYAGTANWNRARQHGSQNSLQCVMSNGQRLSPSNSIETENYIMSVFTVELPQRAG